jgi:hypothetical protein
VGGGTKSKPTRDSPSTDCTVKQTAASRTIFRRFFFTDASKVAWLRSFLEAGLSITKDWASRNFRKPEKIVPKWENSHKSCCLAVFSRIYVHPCASLVGDLSYASENTDAALLKGRCHSVKLCSAGPDCSSRNGILLTFLVFVNRADTNDPALPARLFDLFWKQDEGSNAAGRLMPIRITAHPQRGVRSGQARQN